MRRLAFTIALLPVFTALAACNTSKAPPESAAMSEQVAGEWVLASLRGQAVPPPPGKTDRVPSLAVTRDGAVSGFAGVNRFAGTTDAAGLNEGRITLDRLAATKMAGPEGANRFEAGYLAALGESKVFRVAGSKLELLDAGERVVATFIRR